MLQQQEEVKFYDEEELSNHNENKLFVLLHVDDELEEEKINHRQERLCCYCYCYLVVVEKLLEKFFFEIFLECHLDVVDFDLKLLMM